MRKIVILALVASLLNAVPINSYAQDAAAPTLPPPASTHVVGGAAATGSVEVGIVAVAVSVLGLIALAASTDSGDATPAATSHPR